MLLISRTVADRAGELVKRGEEPLDRLQSRRLKSCAGVCAETLMLAWKSHIVGFNGGCGDQARDENEHTYYRPKPRLTDNKQKASPIRGPTPSFPRGPRVITNHLQLHS
jgi:hypothetical protein